MNPYEWTVEWAQKANLKTWKSESIDSTNAFAKNDSDPATAPAVTEKNPVSEPSLYVTRAQTAGRGRGDNTWITPPEGALLSSWSFALEQVPQPVLSPLVGLALFESARETWREVPFNMKAPNDLFIGDKKVAGLLIETVDQGASKRTVIGLGFNTGSSPEGLESATHLGKHLSRPLTKDSWQQFLKLWMGRLREAVRAGQKERLDANSRMRLIAALNIHPLLKEPILDVDAHGQLHTASGIVRWHEI
jgi:BirA family biotin operon repressor/biotin-[acetyl-CoA-carboxylase] ligase